MLNIVRNSRALAVAGSLLTLPLVSRPSSVEAATSSKPQVNQVFREMREAPSPVAREGNILFVHALYKNGSPWPFKPTKGINHLDPDWTISRKLMGDTFRAAQLQLLRAVKTEEEAKNLNSEINGQNNGVLCIALGLGLRLYPATRSVAPWIGGSCSALNIVGNAETKKVAIRPGDTVWRYDELCHPNSKDKDNRLIHRTVYLVIDCNKPFDFSNFANKFLSASDDEREKLVNEVPQLNGVYYFLRENRARIRVVD